VASIKKNGKKWRVQVFVAGRRASRSFDSKPEACLWAVAQEADMGGDPLPDHTLIEAMEKFKDEVSCHRAGAKWERCRFKRFAKLPFARALLADLRSEDFARWRDQRLRKVKPGTVAREMNLMSSVLETARRDWYWLRENPMRGVRWPKTPKGRARRISSGEEAQLVEAFGLVDGLKANTKTQRVGLMFLLALETGMRSGEMLGLTWSNIHFSDQYVHLPKTKNSDSRDVPLSRRAVEILRTLPMRFGPAFALSNSQRDSLWRKVRDKTGIQHLRFHDSRAEAIWRLSKKLKILDLARAIGHRDIKSLMIYYNESASELARQLG